ncbi:chitinase [Actinocrinis sp.]|uniref:chitinase n=1 Tax=Actinocrinis sp. TaxID=1920516 RepID=UPI002D44833E|nr:chitinase [Actinocrinis sp.]HZP49945.1 chitinase [Actinocrinis sp.]
MTKVRWMGTALAACALVATGAMMPASASAHSPASASSSLSTGASAAAGGLDRDHSTARPLPRHIFAPYFEGYTTDDPAVLSAESGAKYLTLAFIQTPAPGSCDLDWNGNAATPIAWSTYGAAIARMRAAGGDVIPSFGGYSADHAGEEIADSCTDVAKIAADYEKVITTYGVTRLDFDVEDNSQTNPAGIDRRNKAIRLVEQWAACHGRTVQFVYTIGTNMTGLDVPDGISILQNAVTNHARIDIVNIMTFDYYDNAPHEMGQDTITAAKAVIQQLRTVYPHKGETELWHMLGITEMLGIDDFGPPEIFTTADAAMVEHWARSTGIAELSFWALERDNGGCVGTAGSDSCSGIAQSTWQFSHTFEPFTRH